MVESPANRGVSILSMANGRLFLCLTWFLNRLTLNGIFTKAPIIPHNAQDSLNDVLIIPVFESYHFPPSHHFLFILCFFMNAYCAKVNHISTERKDRRMTVSSPLECLSYPLQQTPWDPSKCPSRMAITESALYAQGISKTSQSVLWRGLIMITSDS